MTQRALASSESRRSYCSSVRLMRRSSVCVRDAPTDTTLRKSPHRYSTIRSTCRSVGSRLPVFPRFRSTSSAKALMHLDMARLLSRLRSLRPMTAEGASAVPTGGASTSGNATMQSTGHASRPNFSRKSLRKAYKEWRACSNGVSFRGFESPGRYHRSPLRVNSPPLTSRQTMPSPGTMTTKSISP